MTEFESSIVGCGFPRHRGLRGSRFLGGYVQSWIFSMPSSKKAGPAKIMQKWHVHTALGRGKPSTPRLYNYLNRHFTASSQEAQEQQQPEHSSPRERGHDRTGRASDTYYRSFRPNAVDARDLAAVLNPTPPPPGRSISERIPAGRAPLDARNLGDDRRPPEGPRIIRTGATSRDDDDEGPRILSRRDPSDRQFQGGSTNASHNRSRGGPSSGARKGARTSAGKEKKRAGGVRSGFGFGGGRDRGKAIFQEPDEEEKKYLETKDRVTDYYTLSVFGINAQKHTRELKHKTYTPADMSVDAFQGMGPSLACGERGMTETVTERMMKIAKKKDEYDSRIEELARKYAEGEFCHFRNKQEREDTMRTVERNLAGTGDNAALDEGQEEEKMALVDTRMKEEGEKLAGTLLKGDYYIGPLGKGPTAELLERYTRKNETYRPEHGQALAGKIGTLLPMNAAASPATTAKA